MSCCNPHFLLPVLFKFQFFNCCFSLLWFLLLWFFNWNVFLISYWNFLFRLFHWNLSVSPFFLESISVFSVRSFWNRDVSVSFLLQHICLLQPPLFHPFSIRAFITQFLCVETYVFPSFSYHVSIFHRDLLAFLWWFPLWKFLTDTPTFSSLVNCNHYFFGTEMFNFLFVSLL